MDGLEAELDHLYAVEPGEFVAERDRIARELREAGDREEADRVKALRKPSVSAWTVNQLARRERRQVDLLLDAGHRLREAQAEPKSLEAARRKQRQAMDALGVAARGILAEEGRPSEATVKRVMETLQAAAVSAEGRELLARGRLTGDLEPAGFELLTPAKPATRKAAEGTICAKREAGRGGTAVASGKPGCSRRQRRRAFAPPSRTRPRRAAHWPASEEGAAPGRGRGGEGTGGRRARREAASPGAGDDAVLVGVLREVVESDLDAFYEQQADPEATRMALLPARDRPAFDAHWRRVLTEGTRR